MESRDSSGIVGWQCGRANSNNFTFDMKFIFVGGYMHSGTTMLQNILSKHSSILGVPSETRLMEYWVHNKRASKLRELTQRIHSDLNTKTSSITCYDQSNNLKEFWRCLFDEFNIPYIAEKTPTNIYFSEEILENFGDDARVILIYRSPFQV